MKRHFLLFTWILCLALASGCVTTTSTRAPKDIGRPGVTVEVHEDGTLRLYGNPVDRETLAKRLAREEGADKGRAVVLEAHGDVRRAELAELRGFLVSRRIPNVALATQRNAVAYEGKAPVTPSATAPVAGARGPVGTRP